MQKGQQMSAEQRSKISIAQKGKPKSEEFREKCRKRMQGAPSPSPWVGKKQPKWFVELRVKRGEYHYNYGKGINARHGQSRNGNRTSEYNTWLAMRQRCSNPKDGAYRNYGGRGITVCKRWNKFENFFADMGRRTNGLSLDRINNDGNYEPGNCRWADRKTQFRNSRLRQDRKGRFFITK